ncbi:enoyl-CoA hydratase/isomerase family protein [Variovorax sp.]|uniref:enoyl-CoA hydratase/isomerase family protein n=1 Tax=Variovorax sp. TaxID=1871043 RepID=UPI002D33575C|nr:enoyl-CoA hydratase-related protein [Variovorax sp.]HYP85936.1 enoyl-CoA hydratase-related protein [Variovorax sp.]
MRLTDEVIFEVVDGAIAVVTIDRPAQRNAINAGVIEGLRQAWLRLEADDALRVGILTASGDKAFCAGMDLKAAAAMGLAVPPRDMFPVLQDVVQISKPTIAAVNGVALAGGWLFAQMCDLCIAAEHASFGITEAKVGRGMPWAAPLIRMLPQRIMMEVLLTARPISAQRALALGYVNDVVPLADLRERALDMARGIAANAPLTVKAARELVYLSAEMGRSAALRAAHHLFESVYLSEDAQEGPRAFAEKRSPVWQGR